LILNQLQNITAGW